MAQPNSNSFPRFRQLPPELQMMVWEFAMEPQAIVVRTNGIEYTRPALFTVNQQSRQIALRHYQNIRDPASDIGVPVNNIVYFNPQLDGIQMASPAEMDLTLTMIGDNINLVENVRTRSVIISRGAGGPNSTRAAYIYNHLTFMYGWFSGRRFPFSNLREFIVEDLPCDHVHHPIDTPSSRRDFRTRLETWFNTYLQTVPDADLRMPSFVVLTPRVGSTTCSVCLADQRWQGS